MGKITLFSTNDLNSIVVAKALKSRNLPYTEISLLDHPTKLNQLVALTGSIALPKVFVNTRSIGSGVDPILKELRAFWDFSNKHQTAAEKFKKEVECLADPKNPVFDVPPNDSFHNPKWQPTINLQEITIKLSDENELATISYKEMVEHLKFSLSMKDDVQINGKYYRKVFKGSDVVTVLMNKLKCTPQDATVISNKLMNASVFHLVGSRETIKSMEFINNAAAYYRLQCFESPDILNTYCPTRTMSDSNSNDPFALVQLLFRILNEIQADSVDEIGMLDYTLCAVHPLLPMFEETSCELQVINMTEFSDPEKIALGINIYKLMLSYAFIKIGIPLTEKDRIHFLTNVKFIIGGCTFSFSDWIDGVLRSNQKDGIENKIPFSKNDNRISFTGNQCDPRIHFALNVGSLVGSGVSTPFNEYTPQNLEYELSLSLRMFLEDRNNIEVDSKLGLLHLTRTVAMYMRDFAENEEGFLKYFQDASTGTLKVHMRPNKSQRKMKVVSKRVNWGRFAKNFQRYEKALIQGDLDGYKAAVQRFLTPKDAVNESQRLETLRSLKVLDTTPEERFDCITKEVQVVFAVPIVFVSLIDADRHWNKSIQWACSLPKPNEIPRSISLCAHVILQDDIMILEDALLDDRFADNPVVAGDLKVRFYAGVPLRISGSDGLSHNIGTLCIVDHRPRQISDTEIQMLKHFSNKVRMEILRDNSTTTFDHTSRYFI